jgi:hypothetical protein
MVARARAAGLPAAAASEARGPASAGTALMHASQPASRPFATKVEFASGLNACRYWGTRFGMPERSGHWHSCSLKQAGRHRKPHPCPCAVLLPVPTPSPTTTDVWMGIDATKHVLREASVKFGIHTHTHTRGRKRNSMISWDRSVKIRGQ